MNLKEDWPRIVFIVVVVSFILLAFGYGGCTCEVHINPMPTTLPASPRPATGGDANV